MKVSIITVTYNSEIYLNECIESVIKQDYSNIEYILIDGGSSDNTLNIIDRYKDKFFKWSSEPDDGIYDAINKGIKLATGDIIGILNSDDLLTDNNVVTRIVSALNNSPTLDAVYANINFVDSLENKKVIRHYSSKLFRPWMFRFGFQPAHPTFYAKRDLFKKYGFYRKDLKIAGDFELLLRFLSVYNIKCKYVNDTWVNMRLGGVSTSGFESIFKLNNEIIIACKSNNINTNKIMIYSKYLIKWWGFIFKKH